MLNAYSLGKMSSAKEVIEFLKGAQSEGKINPLQLDKVIQNLEESYDLYMSVQASKIPEEIKNLIEKGQKIQAIKELYSVWPRDLSLVECKDVCDAYDKGQTDNWLTTMSRRATS